MTQEGRPTGIKQGDIARLGIVDFEGRQAQLIGASTESRVGIGHSAYLELDLGGERLALWGYYSGDEFMEVDRQHLG
jgi:hypothetical protein